jgi:DNA-binding SARP family transcriptional activator
MRRAQQRRRRTGRIIKLPEAQLTDVERGLRVASDLEALSTIDLAMRLLGWATRATDEPGSPLVAVRMSLEQVELLFDPDQPPREPPMPFQPTDDPALWVLPAQSQERYRAESPPALQEVETPCPALVTVGYGGSSTLLVNLETLGSLSVGGEDATLVLEAVVVELGTLPWADSVDTLVVGHGSELKALERVRQVPTVAAAVAEARQRLVADERLAAASALPSTASARWRAGDSAWDALVVVCMPSAAEAEPEACRRLVELAGDGRNGTVALIGAAAPARWIARADGGPLSLTGPTGWSLLAGVRSQPSARSLLSDVDSILAVATGEPDGPRPAAEIESESAGRSVAGTTPTDAPITLGGPPEHEVEVRVLGPVEVLGAKPFARAWALELVVYLVMHESGATTDQWASALWPDRLMASASLHSTASSARRALGTSSTGADHLPRSHGRLTLGPTVTSDWARFRQLAASDDPERLTEALHLIRGRPFLGLRSTDWVLLEGFMADIEGLVVDVACRAAEHALRNGNAAEAEVAARLGLRVSEFDERLYRILLRAADAAGNPAGVESTMRELVRLVADEVEPYDAVHPETLELYKQLSRRAGIRRGA